MATIGQSRVLTAPLKDKMRVLLSSRKSVVSLTVQSVYCHAGAIVFTTVEEYDSVSVSAFSIWTEENNYILSIPNSSGHNESVKATHSQTESEKSLTRKILESFYGQLGLVRRGRVLSLKAKETPL